MKIKIVRKPIFKQITDSDNGKTIGEIMFRSNESLTIERRPTPPIPEADLVDEQGNIVEKVENIITSWFTKFSKNGLMGNEEMAAFIHSCI